MTSLLKGTKDHWVSQVEGNVVKLRDHGVIWMIHRLADPLRQRDLRDRGVLFQYGSQIMEQWMRLWEPENPERKRLQMLKHPACQQMLELAARCWQALLLDGEQLREEEMRDWLTQQGQVEEEVWSHPLWRLRVWTLWNAVVSSACVSPLALNAIAERAWFEAWDLVAQMVALGKPLPMPLTVEERRRWLEMIVGVGIRLILAIEQPRRLERVQAEFELLKSSTLLAPADDSQADEQSLDQQSAPSTPALIERWALSIAQRMLHYLLTPPVFPWPKVLSWVKVMPAIFLLPVATPEHTDLFYLLKSVTALVTQDVHRRFWIENAAGESLLLQGRKEG